MAREILREDLTHVVDSFLLSKRVQGCTSKTLEVYGYWVRRFVAEASPHPLDLRRWFASIQESGVSQFTLHQAYRTIKTFLRYCLDVGAIQDDPMRGFRIKTPRALPAVPTEEELRAVLSSR